MSSRTSTLGLLLDTVTGRQEEPDGEAKQREGGREREKAIALVIPSRAR